MLACRVSSPTLPWTVIQCSSRAGVDVKKCAGMCLAWANLQLTEHAKVATRTILTATMLLRVLQTDCIIIWCAVV